MQIKNGDIRREFSEEVNRILQKIKNIRNQHTVKKKWEKLMDMLISKKNIKYTKDTVVQSIALNRDTD